jgi:hypothetical protein
MVPILEERFKEAALAPNIKALDRGMELIAMA